MDIVAEDITKNNRKFLEFRIRIWPKNHANKIIDKTSKRMGKQDLIAAADLLIDIANATGEHTNYAITDE